MKFILVIFLNLFYLINGQLYRPLPSDYTYQVNQTVTNCYKCVFLQGQWFQGTCFRDPRIPIYTAASLTYNDCISKSETHPTMLTYSVTTKFSQVTLYCQYPGYEVLLTMKNSHNKDLQFMVELVYHENPAYLNYIDNNDLRNTMNQKLAPNASYQVWFMCTSDQNEDGQRIEIKTEEYSYYQSHLSKIAKNYDGLIIGFVIGGTALIIFTVLTFMLCLKKREKGWKCRKSTYKCKCLKKRPRSLLKHKEAKKLKDAKKRYIQILQKYQSSYQPDDSELQTYMHTNPKTNSSVLPMITGKLTQIPNPYKHLDINGLRPPYEIVPETYNNKGNKHNYELDVTEVQSFMQQQVEFLNLLQQQSQILQQSMQVVGVGVQHKQKEFERQNWDSPDNRSQLQQQKTANFQIQQI